MSKIANDAKGIYLRGQFLGKVVNTKLLMIGRHIVEGCTKQVYVIRVIKNEQGVHYLEGYGTDGSLTSIKPHMVVDDNEVNQEKHYPFTPELLAEAKSRGEKVINNQLGR